MSELSLILCASPRSGSYFLLDLLEQCGLPHGEEWLTPYHVASCKRRYGQTQDLPYADFLKLLSARERVGGRFVLKAMFPQFRELRETLEARDGPGEANLSEKIAEIFPNPRFVYLVREDKVAQAISHFKARQTGRWVNHGGRSGGDRFEPVYSFIGIAHQFAEREYSERQWEATFRDSGIEPFRIRYESVREDPVKEILRLFEWLGLGKPKATPETAQAKVAPMTTRANKEWKTLFLEDREACREQLEPEDARRLDHLTIGETDFPDYYELPAYCRFRITVANPSGKPVEVRGMPDGRGWLRIAGSLQGATCREWFQQEIRPVSADRFVAEGVLPAPKGPGRYVLHLALADRVLDHGEIADLATMTREIEFRLPEPRMTLRRIMEGVEDLESGWQHVGWFGFFLDEKFPWIYHAEHEWLFFKSETPGKGRFTVLDANLGWIELDQATYPEIRSLESGETLRFLGTTGGIRHFRRMETGEAFTAETNRPEHLVGLRTDKAD